MALMAKDGIGDIASFLINHFERGTIQPEIFAVDMADYAACGKFLSTASTNDAQTAMKLVATRIYNSYVAELAYEWQNDRRRIGAFSAALKVVCAHYGFSDKVLMLNGSQNDDDFAYVVRNRHLFRDVYTSAHGEYTHALQWLLMAEASRVFGTGLIGLDIPSLYARSVLYKSRKTFVTKFGNRQIAIWNLLVDCFNGDEDYTANTYTRTMRCPQIFTSKIATILPPTSWLASYIAQRATGRAKYVTKDAQALNAIDPGEGRGTQPVSRYNRQPGLPRVYEKNYSAMRTKPVPQGSLAYKALDRKLWD